ncbi:MAG: hypothetical protein Q9166_006279 [cf. Caloplaca sp. 2 TL-2023]
MEIEMTDSESSVSQDDSAPDLLYDFFASNPPSLPDCLGADHHIQKYFKPKLLGAQTTPSSTSPCNGSASLSMRVSSFTESSQPAQHDLLPHDNQNHTSLFLPVADESPTTLDEVECPLSRISMDQSKTSSTRIIKATPKPQRAKSSSSTRVIKAPRKPNEALKQYSTSHYARYNPAANNIAAAVGKFRMTYSTYDAFSLVMDPTMAIRNIPTSGVRVDDYLAGRLLMSNLSANILHQNWPAEFDHAGMIRATRIPLGHAAKMLVRVGHIDIDGNVVQPGQEGWYYKWWRGLHCLMGKEGYDAGLYWVRPSWEKFRCEGMGFKIRYMKMSYKAVVQLATGDPSDPTPGL